MNGRDQRDVENDSEKIDDAVDPRVQIELERLNTATDDINKLEVDLDEARATFRQLLCESTVKIDGLAKKLGACIEKSRPYYDSRFKAKEALQETQKAAIRFERANSQHAAAKEMVYLAEEGLRTEGRCFDHAWQVRSQSSPAIDEESHHLRFNAPCSTCIDIFTFAVGSEGVKTQRMLGPIQNLAAGTFSGSLASLEPAAREMLNHATSRVNESEHERALSEVEHRQTTALYHRAEHNVQRLQRELKRAIAKSSMGARRSLLLINSIAYRHNLLMLPYYEMKAHFNQMLDEQKLRVGVLERSVAEAKMTYAEALRNLECISDEIHRTRRYDGADYLGKRNDYSNQTNTATPTDSSITGSPDSTDYTSDEYLRLPDKMGPNPPCLLPTRTENDVTPEYLGLSNLNLCSTEPRKYIKRDRPRSIATTDTCKHINVMKSQASTSTPQLSNLAASSDRVKKIKTVSPSGGDKKNNGSTHNGDEWTEISLNNSPDEICYNENYSDEDEPIPYKPLPMDFSPEPESKDKLTKKKLVTQQSMPVISKMNDEDKKEEVTRSPSLKNRAKLDTSLASWISRSSAGGDVSCGSSTNSSRRQSLDILWSGGTGERVKELLSHGMMMLNISSLTERRSSEPRGTEKDKEKAEKADKAEAKGKKVPSPLEKSMSYLNPEDETSDSESLASVEMLTEDQISSLMMEQDINEVCQEILGTPLVEVCPLLQQLQQQQ